MQPPTLAGWDDPTWVMFKLWEISDDNEAGAIRILQP